MIYLLKCIIWCAIHEWFSVYYTQFTVTYTDTLEYELECHMHKLPCTLELRSQYNNPKGFPGKEGYLKCSQLVILTLIFPSCEPDASISESLLKSTQSTASSCIINISCKPIIYQIMLKPKAFLNSWYTKTHHFRKHRGRTMVRLLLVVFKYLGSIHQEDTK